MSNFKKFSEAVTNKFNNMCKENERLYVADISKDELWDLYLNSFPEGTNNIYKERREYDCDTCKQFIKNITNVVAIKNDLTVESIWDLNDLEYPYDIVAKALQEKVKNAKIRTIFSPSEPKYGDAVTRSTDENNNVIKWYHFEAKIPKNHRQLSNTNKGKIKSMVSVFKRGLEEITNDAIKMVIDLINENSIYRGQEFKDSVLSFKKLKQEYHNISNKDTFLWKNVSKQGSTIKNSVIGTLLTDISEGKDLESAVKAFESKVAPANYKRPKALVTKKMIEAARKTISELGLEESLKRRQAVSSDLSVNDILFVDREVKLKDKDIFDELMEEVSDKITLSSIENAQEINIEKFISDVLPNSKTVYLIQDTMSKCNKVYLSAPVNPDAKTLFKWNNNFAWSYDGNVTDCTLIAEEVKKKGGVVNGNLRFSIMWNEKGMDNIDLDAHCIESFGEHIFYARKISKASKGQLDIDITKPRGKLAVENIVWQNKLLDGIYKMHINLYTGHPVKDKAEAEIVYKGHYYRYEVHASDFKGKNAYIAEITVKDNQVVSIKHLIQPSISSGTYTKEKVNLICLSPNYWYNKQYGNKHYFFLTDEVKAEEPFRGIYNEFLKPELEQHRKVFEVLGSKTMCEPNPEGLAGYGFSSTVKRDFYVEVDKKIYKIKIQ